ncbi:SET domain-containing protein isoform 2 [Hibiscus syriacus]|uniref:SET domain-containing protein isoform 2 n=1 Tax=Hibiscus syriacus TaxID=106335 RepID=A0A6A3CYL1_HIBSY|nr:SET domain-containing protein isoform 2 [Hibiscus syriacus]
MIVNGQRSGRVNSRVGSGQTGQTGSKLVKPVFQQLTLPAAARAAREQCYELDFNSAETLTAPPPHAPPSTANKVDTDGLETAQGTRWCKRICSSLDDEHNGSYKTTIGTRTAPESRSETDVGERGFGEWFSVLKQKTTPLRGKLDQLRRCFEIQFAAGRDLRPGQLGSMIETLSNWYLDMLPTTFGNPLWFTDDEMLEFRGTILYRATELRKKDLISVYEDKVKGLVKKLLALDGVSESEVCFEYFLWANSIFWSRALNLPLPHSYVFPQIQEDTETTCPVERSSEVKVYCINMELRLKIFIYFGFISGFEGHENDNKVNGATSTSKQEETVWVEGLLPGIDFCNHDLKAVATWEVSVPKIYNEQITDLLDPNQRNLQDVQSSDPLCYSLYSLESITNFVGSNKEWKPKVISSNFGKGSRIASASDVPTSSVEVNAHSQPVLRVLDYEEATSKLQKNLEVMDIMFAT